MKRLPDVPARQQTRSKRTVTGINCDPQSAVGLVHGHRLGRRCSAALLAGLTCLLTSLGLLPSSSVLAQNEISLRHYSVQDGLPEESAFAILQDRLGFMWLGTQNGLVRFDGYTFTVYRPGHVNSEGMAGGNVRALHEDSRGDLWVGTLRYLNRLRRTDNRFESYRHDPNDNGTLSDGGVVAIHEDSNGYLWLVTSTARLDRIDPESGAITRYSDRVFGGATLATPPDETPLAWLQASDGRIWVGSDGGGLARMDSEGDGVVRYRHDADQAGSISSNRICCLLEDRYGVIWVGTKDAGLNRFNPATETFTRFRRRAGNKQSIGSDRIGHLAADTSGHVWIGSSEYDVSRFDPITGLSERHELDPRHPSSRDQPNITVVDRQGGVRVLTSAGKFYLYHQSSRSFEHQAQSSESGRNLIGAYIRAVFEDNSGGLWIGTHDRGIGRVDPYGNRFPRYKVSLNDQSSPNANFVRAIAETRGGQLWIGTESGIGRFDPVMERAVPGFGDTSPASALRDEVVRCLFVDDAGTLWIGTSQGAHHLTDVDRGYIQSYLHDPRNEATLSGNRVTTIAQDFSGALWMGTSRSGLNRLDRATQRFERFREQDGLVDDWVYVIITDREGLLWIGTERGLSSLDPKTRKFTSYLTDVDLVGAITALFEDTGGRLWIGTYSMGVLLFDRASGTAQQVLTESNGLPNDRVAGILGDDAGRLWISTRNGLTRFRPDTGEFKNYDADDGLPGDIFQPRSTLAASDGHLYFGGDEGFTGFVPGDIHDDPIVPRVVLTQFRLAGVAAGIGGGSPLQSDIAFTDRITLGHNQNDFTFRFAALQYTRPERNQYRYRMMNFGAGEWREIGDTRSASFMNLPWGEYVFEVIASNHDGAWNTDGVSVAVVIRPPWWRRWWAYSIDGLVLLIGIFGVDRFQRSRLIRKEREAARIKEAELRALAAESQSRALEAENARRGLELEKAQELAVAYKRLKDTQQQLIQSEKLASLGSLAAGIAHEIKNPLNFVNNFAEVVEELADEVSTDIRVDPKRSAAEVLELIEPTLVDLKESAAQITKHGKRADAIVRGMLEHSRESGGERQETDLRTLLDECIGLSRHSGGTVRIERDYADVLPTVTVVQQEIGRVLINLLTNGFYAVHKKQETAPEGYEPTVWVSVRVDDGHVEVQVRDNGMGIPDNIRDQIFEPFFTTKPTGTGTGLGLSLSYDIVTKGHGGRLLVDSELGVSTTFTVMLPLDQAG